MTMTLGELERRIKELRPQLYDDSPVILNDEGRLDTVQVTMTTMGRKALALGTHKERE